MGLSAVCIEVFFIFWTLYSERVAWRLWYQEEDEKISIRLIKVSPTLYKWCIGNYYLPIIPNNQYSLPLKKSSKFYKKNRWKEKRSKAWSIKSKICRTNYYGNWNIASILTDFDKEKRKRTIIRLCTKTN